MSPRAAFWTRVGAAVAATLALAPGVGVLLPETPFHRVLTRLFQGALVVALLWGRGRPSTWPSKIRAMGLRGPHRLARAAAGAAVALALFTLLLLLEWALGGRTAAPEHPRGLAAHLGIALLVGAVVSLFEEVLFRGYMKDALGGLQSAIVFAAVHYLQPLKKSAPAGEDFDPLLGFKRLHEMCEAIFEPRNATLGLASLFLFGLALNRLRERTGTLYAGVGVHAGLVFALTLYRRVLDGTPDGSPWIHGGARVHDGVLGTLALLVLLVLAHRAPLPGRLRPDAV